MSLNIVTAAKFMHFSFGESHEVVNLNEEENKVREPKTPITKDRSLVIPVETSIKYLKSDAYKRTYGNLPVWSLYIRNYKGHYLPKKTRKTCIRNNIITTGSPCPICRDEYLVIDPTNVDLLKQFISEFSGEILHFNKTGLCQKAHQKLLVAIMKAKDCGFLTYDVPMRIYDYDEWK
ncbi:mitochondrial ribosomal protein S18B isoform X2 [Nomia melanderi]|uniref:mitochondrial ribosomal protein S18B isoform X2 n=1 Tax=Nomia melanderi TaxID=2448451 RepID=UPI0013041833|nr:28S ribosomal protein S18b, mitochondrial isoform X2 [Nomia melanderi]